MLAEERFREILKIVNDKKTVTVQELTALLQTSESTIRRDLTTLHQRGALIKVHGGATTAESETMTRDADLSLRSTLNKEAKAVIGKYAASLIREDDFVYLDAGSSVDVMIDYITESGALYVTNSVSHAQKLLKKGMRVFLIGGELKAAKVQLERAKKELSANKTAYNKDIEVGVMIETPAAVMISGELAREVDFFSIGTNDLLQFTLGMDRTNAKIDSYYNPHHPALLKMIRIITNNGHLEEKRISICGDLAADLSLTEYFLQIGIDELSVAPGQVLGLRKKIREIQ